MADLPVNADPPPDDDLDTLDQTWLTDPDAPENFNWGWRKVIDGLMSGLSTYKAYAAAYDIDINDEGKRRVAEANGSRLLRNVKFKLLWKRVIEERGFNDEIADWRLTDIIINPATTDKDRLAAIKHYNELRGRVIKKTDLTSDGKPILQPLIISPIKPRNVASEDQTATGS